MYQNVIPSLELTVRRPRPTYSRSEVRGDQLEILYCKSLIAVRHFTARLATLRTDDSGEHVHYSRLIVRWSRVRDAVRRLLVRMGRTL